MRRALLAVLGAALAWVSLAQETQTWQHAAFEGRRFACPSGSGRARRAAAWTTDTKASLLHRAARKGRAVRLEKSRPIPVAAGGRVVIKTQGDRASLGLGPPTERQRSPKIISTTRTRRGTKHRKHSLVVRYGIFDRWSEPVDVAGEVECAAERFGGPLRGRLEGSVKECRCLAGLDYGRPLAPTCPRLGRRVAVFGFGKDEVDVVAAWVHHHASLFGYANLHVVDNHSTDGTWEVLLALREKHGIGLSRETSYLRKQAIMQRMMKEGRATHDVLVPLDLDEFVAHYDRRSRRLTAGGVCAVVDGLNVTQPQGFTFTTVAAVGAPTECPRGALRRHAGGDEKMFVGAGATIDYSIRQGPRLR